MRRETSRQARITLAEELWEFVRTDPRELAEQMHTNDLAVDILRAGLDLYIQQVRSEEPVQENEEEDSRGSMKKSVVDLNEQTLAGITILQSCQENRENAFWYAGEIARTEKYILLATQEITCRFQEEDHAVGSKLFYDDEARKEAKNRHFTDDDLEEHVYWYQYNWFEIRNMGHHQIADSLCETWTEGLHLLRELHLTSI